MIPMTFKLPAPLRRHVVVMTRVVYGAPAEVVAAAVPLPPGLAVERLDADAVRRYFGDDPGVRRRFERFLDRGHVGLVLHEDGAWRAVAWSSLEDGPQPVTVPPSVRGQPWIFNLHTRPAARGRGLGKAMLAALARELAGRPGRWLHADVEIGNAASRRTFLGVGFRPWGLLHTLEVPRLDWAQGVWRATRPHPAVPTETKRGAFR